MDSHEASPPSSEPSDREIMARIREDEEAALDLLIERYWTPLVRYAVRFLDRTDDAEEVVQEAFVRVWRKRRSWRPSGTVSGYVFSIVRNLCLNEQERRSVRKDWSDRQSRRRRYSPSPDQVFQRREVLSALRDAIDALPERRREVFRLACLEGLSYREVAETMGIAVSTVANQMSSALDELREALRPVSDRTI